MQEIRLHGRGGQGVRFAARLLARALFLSGYQTQDFAIYGAERRGAPVTGFVRFGEKPILERGYIFEPNAVVLLDDTLNFSSVTSGLKGTVMINSHRKPEYFSKMFGEGSNIGKIYCIDATQIALHIIGKPTANAAILGALARIMGVDPKKLEEAMRMEFEEEGLKEVAQKNIEAAIMCHEAVK